MESLRTVLLRIVFGERFCSTGFACFNFTVTRMPKLVVNSRGEEKEVGSIVNHTPLPKETTLDFWLEEMDRRATIINELDPLPRKIEVGIPIDGKSIVCAFADTHLGNPNVNIDLFKRDLEVIKNHPLVRAIFLGDMIDGYIFGSEQNKTSAGLNEQYEIMELIMEETQGKLLAAVKGDHDLWTEDKGKGMSPYRRFSQKYGIHVLRGMSEVDVIVGENEQEKYSFVVAHRMPGFSMYNKTHSANRASKFGVQGAQIYVRAHEHEKAYSQQMVQTINGDFMQHYVGVGPYKVTDDYAKKIGYATLREQSLGAYWIVLDSKKNAVNVFDNPGDAIDFAVR